MRWKRFIHNTLIFSMIFYACFLGKGENFACAQKRVRSLSKRVATATRTRGISTSSSRRFVVKGRRSVSDVARRLTSLSRDEPEETGSNKLFDVTTDFAGKSRTRTGLTATEAANFIVEERNKVVQGLSEAEDSQTASASGLSTTQNTQNAVFDNIIAPHTPTRLETREQAAARTPTRLETKERAAEKEEAEKEEGKKLPSSVGALMKFESFSFAGRSGFKFGTTFGYEYEEDKILVGALLPYDFVKSNDANLEFHRIGPVPYANYAILTEGPDLLTLRLGAFASLIGVVNTETAPASTP